MSSFLFSRATLGWGSVGEADFLAWPDRFAARIIDLQWQLRVNAINITELFHFPKQKVKNISGISEQACARIGSTHGVPAQSSRQLLAEVTVVVPCFNEADSIPLLQKKLLQLLQTAGQCAPTYAWHFLFVDDGSHDDTLRQLQSAFGSWPETRVLRHDQNRGLIAALQTGFQACTTEWVAVIDSDCTYDPLLLLELLDKAQREQLDVVTASPYHLQGSVGNVPAWRIFLSRIASWLYRVPMRSKLTCYTCCVRVYRTSLLQACRIHSSGFVGVTELLWRLDQSGVKIGEVPASLSPRTTGVSKMRTLKTMLNHFRLLGSIAKEKLAGKAVKN